MQDSLDESIKKLDISPDEMKRLSNCFKNPEFKTLFSEYLDEISDPKIFEKYEKEITEYEKQYGVNTKFVNSIPQFVIKTKHWDDNIENPIKIFINVCSSTAIDPPKFERSVLGSDCSLPHCYSPLRKVMEKGESVKIADVSFNPAVFNISCKNNEFLNFVKTTAFETIVIKYKLNPGLTQEFARAFSSKAPDERKSILMNSFHTLKGVKSKGNVQSCVLRSSAPDSKQLNELDEKLKPPFLKKVQPEAKNDVKNESEPTYKIVYGNNFELTNFANSPNIQPTINRPEYIKVEIDLPEFENAKQFDLDIFAERLQFKSFKPKEYHLDLTLKYAIDENCVEAIFDKSTQKLSVKMPLIIQKKNNNFERKMSPGRFSVAPTSLAKEQPVTLSDRLNKCHENNENSIDLKCIKIEEVNQLHLELSKDSDLLPIKLFQDTSTFSVMLCVKQVIRDSIVINWTKRKISKSDFKHVFSSIKNDTGIISFPSHFMSIQVKSQPNNSNNEEEKKIQNFGIILEFPALRKDLETDFDEADEYGQNSPFLMLGDKVELMFASWSFRNVVLVFKKPMINKESFFWSSVASGRTLDSGLLITQFHGINSAFKSVDSEQDSGFKKILENNLTNFPLIDGNKSRKLSDSIKLPNYTQKNNIKGILKRRTFSECDDSNVFDLHIESIKSPGVAEITPICEKCGIKDILISNQEANNSVKADSPIHSNSLSLNGSLINSPNDEGSKSIFSESSDAKIGIKARRRFFSYTFDENDIFDLPLNSQSESTEDISTKHSSKCVFFQKHDVKMDFCPEDSVSTLHQSIQNRKKKAKSRERKRLSSTSEADDMNQKSRKSGGRRKGKYSLDQAQEAQLTQEMKDSLKNLLLN